METILWHYARIIELVMALRLWSISQDGGDLTLTRDQNKVAMLEELKIVKPFYDGTASTYDVCEGCFRPDELHSTSVTQLL
jgi:hypothetical protein